MAAIERTPTLGPGHLRRSSGQTVGSVLRDRAVDRGFEVKYFGFPSPRFGELTDLATGEGLVVIEDTRHGPLSIDQSGRPLGTRADIGFTSVHKLLPIPDGGILYTRDDGVDEERRSGFTTDDFRYAAREMLPSMPVALTRLRSTDGRGPAGELASGYRRPMSRLSHSICSTIEAAPVEGRRRAAYRGWSDGLGSRPDVDPVFDRLPEGVVPFCCPLRSPNAAAIRDWLRGEGVYGVDRWPPLSDAITADWAYDRTVTLAESILTVPCHQDVSPSTVRTICANHPDELE